MKTEQGTGEGDTLLEASRITMRYAGRSGHSSVTLQGIDLKVNAGEFVCLLGPSGCGKTTLLKLFGGFLNPSEGAILFRNRELTGATPQIVMIFQEPNLFPWLTVEQNVVFGPRMAGRSKGQIANEIERLLRTVGLYEARRLYPHQLSGGMRQRAAIARALATQPNALLLDEPFSALDVSLRRRMQDFVRALWQSNRTTMIMVTHSIEEALLCAQRIVVLGGTPSGIIDDIDVSAPDLKDRYSPAFVAAQKKLDALIDHDKEKSSADARASIPLATRRAIIAS